MGMRACLSLKQFKLAGKIGIKINIETVEKPVSERLMENVHPAGFAAGRNPEEGGVHRSTPQ
jgi:hypothetical protein